MENRPTYDNLSEFDKQKLRLNRFNTGENNSVDIKVIFKFNNNQTYEEEKEKMMERQRKFGVIEDSPIFQNDQLQKRLERFGPARDDQVFIL